MGKVKPVKALGLLLSALLASSAFAAETSDGTANNSFASAFNVNGYFSTGTNPNVVDAGTYPWATVHATGQDYADYFMFTTASSGTATLDVDNSSWQLDTTLYVYNSSNLTTPIGSNEDSNPSQGAGGSVTGFDPFLTFSATAGATYYVKITDNNLSNPLSGTYDLQIQTPVPEPETYAMMLAGLGLMGTIARRRKANRAI